MELPTDEALNDADARGRDMMATEPRAQSARYEAESGCVIVDLVNGCAYSFPAELAEELQGASAADLAIVEVEGLGFNLSWPTLDVDLYVPALVAGIFGTKAWMSRELARAAGRAKSPAKSAAARRNGAKGGRPKKAAAG